MAKSGLSALAALLVVGTRLFAENSFRFDTVQQDNSNGGHDHSNARLGGSGRRALAECLKAP